MALLYGQLDLLNGSSYTSMFHRSVVMWPAAEHIKRFSVRLTVFRF